jgi:ArsR family transcriptional regulator
MGINWQAEEGEKADWLAATDTIAKKVGAIADPVRLMIISLLRASGEEGVVVRDLVPSLGVTQPTVSHHLGILREAGFVRRARHGVWRVYFVNEEAVTGVLGEALAAAQIAKMRPQGKRKKATG